MIQAKATTCPYCDSRQLVKKGTRGNSTRKLQVYRCKDCFKYFTPMSALKTKYAPSLLSRALLLYFQGYSQEAISLYLRAKHKIIIPRRTIGNWISKYKSICTFYPLRKTALTNFSPSQLIASYTLEHRQVYIFKKHSAKLQFLLQTIGTRAAQNLSAYLADIMTKTFPHQLFHPEEEQDGQSNRSSQLKFQTLPFITAAKHNNANDLAALGLLLARRTKERHPMIEDFMLACDGRTIAIEVPVYLQKEDIEYFRDKGFYLPLTAKDTPITGHIDVLQIRNGLIHILDYKPDASKINPANQLLLYALALASRTRLPLKSFVCAWFDEKDYFSFYPLHAIYQKREAQTSGVNGSPTTDTVDPTIPVTMEQIAVH